MASSSLPFFSNELMVSYIKKTLKLLFEKKLKIENLKLENLVLNGLDFIDIILHFRDYELILEVHEPEFMIIIGVFLIFWII